MRPIFANSAWIDTPEKFILGGGHWSRRSLRVRYGLIVHPKVGPVLIDTGYTAHTTDQTDRSFGLRTYNKILGPRLVEAEQPTAFLEQYGITPSDITHVIVTHFHADHVSGLNLFSNARFIASQMAWRHLKEKSYLNNLRHGVFSELFPDTFEARLIAIEQKADIQNDIFGQVWDIFGDNSVLAVPLPGHADGHFGLLFEGVERPLLYATDVQWLTGALPPEHRPRYPSRLIAHDPSQLDIVSDLVWKFQQEHGDVVLCHDDAITPFDFEAVVSKL